MSVKASFKVKKLPNGQTFYGLFAGTQEDMDYLLQKIAPSALVDGKNHHIEEKSDGTIVFRREAPHGASVLN